jgi:hypothetical protein
VIAKAKRREDIENVESVFWKRWKEADHGFFSYEFCDWEKADFKTHGRLPTWFCCEAEKHSIFLESD